MQQEQQGPGAGFVDPYDRPSGMLIPGEPLVDLICADGPVMERLLEEIAHPFSQPSRHKRRFGDWCDGLCEGAVLTEGREIPLSLRRLNGGEGPKGPRVLVMRDSPNNRLTMKPVVHDSAGTLALQLSARRCERRLPSIASQVVALFLVHGRGWKDSGGNFFHEPYGSKPNGARKKRNREPRRRHGSFLR